MKILINGKEVSLDDVSPESTVADLIDLLEPEFQDNEMALMDVIVDGVSFSPDARSEFEKRKLLELASIELIGQTAREILEQAVADGEEAFPYLETLAGEIAGDLRLGRNREGIERLVAMIEGLQWMTTVLQKLVVVFASRMTENGQEIQRQDLIERLKKQISGLQTAQESQDWVGVADLLEYEFPDLFKESRTLFKHLTEQG